MPAPVIAGTPVKVAHLTTVDMSLRYLLLPQLQAVIDAGGEVVGISAPGPWVAELEALGIRHRALGVVDPVVLAARRPAGRVGAVAGAARGAPRRAPHPQPQARASTGGSWAGSPRVPIVVNTVHGLYATPDDRWAKRALVYTLEAVAARCSDAELVQNPEDLALLRRWRISPKAELLGNGVDLAALRPGPRRRRTRGLRRGMRWA